MNQAILAAFLVACTVFLTAWLRSKCRRQNRAVPISVNYHFTRKCNAACKFCFHTAKTSYGQPEERARQGLALLKRAGMCKVNFAGGEPFLYPKLLGSMLIYCTSLSCWTGL